MVKAVKRVGRTRAPEPMLADRLLALFGFELGVLERSVAPLRSEAEEGGREIAAGAKGRIEALGQMVRTLEKLLELRQLESLASGAGAEGPDAEAERLARELMRRLRVLDRRRRASGLSGSGAGGAGDGSVGAEAGQGMPVEAHDVTPAGLPAEVRAVAALPI